MQYNGVSKDMKDLSARATFAQLVGDAAELIKARALESANLYSALQKPLKLQSRQVPSAHQILNCLAPIEKSLFETICLFSKWAACEPFIGDALVFDLVYSWCLRCP